MTSSSAPLDIRLNGSRKQQKAELELKMRNTELEQQQKAELELKMRNTELEQLSRTEDVIQVSEHLSDQ